MTQGFIAAARFGYGTGPNDPDIAAINHDPRGWLTAQIGQPDRPSALDGQRDSVDLVVGLEDFRFQRRQAQQMEKSGDAVAEADMANKSRGQAVQQIYQDEVGARVNAAIQSRTPFHERLVAFWANHFTVSAQRPEIRPLAGAFEREAIRPYVAGRFHDMLLASTRHPAMGIYLDNAMSIGPNSPAGLRQHRGVNENLGREIMELHTLGVDGGYTEDDVRALARILTGWSIGRLQDPAPGRFTFFDRAHEPGPKQFLGQTIAEGGEQEGLTALAVLSAHPSTARHVATKLARHFVVDNPPPALVHRLAQTFVKTHGDLAAVSRVLVASPEAWQHFGTKIKSPYDFVVSSGRAFGQPIEQKFAAGSLNILGQPLFVAPSPAGWPDDNASWSGPEAVMLRLQWAQSFADRNRTNAEDPSRLTQAVLMGIANTDLAQAVARAESRPMAVAMLLSSPQFQRR